MRADHADTDHALNSRVFYPSELLNGGCRSSNGGTFYLDADQHVLQELERKVVLESSASALPKKAQQALVVLLERQACQARGLLASMQAF